MLLDRECCYNCSVGKVIPLPLVDLTMNKTKKKTVEQIVQSDGRYPPEAFEFVRDGLAYTVRRVHPDAESCTREQRHITGRELSLGLRDFAIKRYGVLARAVLNHWNIHQTCDFGRIVFAMVDNGLMRKTPRDSVRDFDNVFEFDQAFEPPARPPAAPRAVFDLRRECG